MDSIALQTLLIAIVISISCSLLGIFLVLRKMSMMIDAISHTVLLGIVVAYWIFRDLTSMWILVGATLIGIITVFLIELLVSTKRTTEDAATGAIFPFLFSLAVILITTKFHNTHLDSHAINGNLEFAAYEQLQIFNFSVGSKTLFISLIVLAIIILFITVLFKELKVISFDKALAVTLGISPAIIHYLLMSLVSLTAVNSFNSVGSILVITMMIGPAVTSLLVTKDLKKALVVSALFAAFNSALGYFISMYVLNGNVNIASTMATVTFITFLLVWTLEPKKGLITSINKKLKQKEEFEMTALIFHIGSHRNTEEEYKELHLSSIKSELNWNKEKFNKYLYKSISNGYLDVKEDIVVMTELGYNYYQFQIKTLLNDV